MYFDTNDNKATKPVDNTSFAHRGGMENDDGYRQYKMFQDETANQALEFSGLDPLTMFIGPSKAAHGFKVGYNTEKAMQHGDKTRYFWTNDLSDDFVNKVVDKEALGLHNPRTNTVFTRGNRNDLDTYPTLRHEMKHARNKELEKGYPYVSPKDNYELYRMSREEMSAFKSEMKAYDTAIEIAREQGDRKMFDKLHRDKNRSYYETFLATHRNPEEILPFNNDILNSTRPKEPKWKAPTMFEQLTSMDL